MAAAHDGRRFDVILGSDIIYHRTDLDALIDTIGFFLTDEEAEAEEGAATTWSVTNEDALVVITMQERLYGALDHFIGLVQERLGLVSRVLDVPCMVADEDGGAMSGGYWVGGNHRMVIFHHHRTSLDLSLLGPKVAQQSTQQGDEESLLLAISP